MDVASYLRRHPEFLNEFPDLALALRLPREQGPAASLASYQLSTARQEPRTVAPPASTSSRSRTMETSSSWCACTRSRCR